jgi:hypothetical protein
MAIVAKASGSTFTPAPAGTHQAVCVDVVDRGIQDVEWKGQKKKRHKVSIHWLINEMRPEDGKPFMLSKWYTLDLSENANLRKDLQAWRGKPFASDELDGFDLENLLGANCILTVVHAAKDGKTYANIAGIGGLMKGMPKMEVPSDYIRLADRPPREEADDRRPNTGPVSEMPTVNDDDIPF